MEQVQAEMKPVPWQLEQEFPEVNCDASASVIPLRRWIGNELQPLMWLMVLALVLLTASVTWRGASSSDPLAARKRWQSIALGYSRFRLMRQLLTESPLLSLLSGVLSLFSWLIVGVKLLEALLSMAFQTPRLT
ncbi:MAG: hypothetical protein M2R45_00766 [Verrucomicrobia subdivision 3 bacterium]|nr:hypothetical protein [Limisphaerales bacterium]MCS1413128.1 hypothetical protein [Limisphaerales bacterium]